MTLILVYWWANDITVVYRLNNHNDEPAVFYEYLCYAYALLIAE